MFEIKDPDAFEDLQKVVVGLKCESKMGFSSEKGEHVIKFYNTLAGHSPITGHVTLGLSVN